VTGCNGRALNIEAVQPVRTDTELPVRPKRISICKHTNFWVSVCLAAFALLPCRGLAAAPLHEQVDKLVAAKFAKHPVAAGTDEAEFLRRVWLDFDGGIPSVSEAKSFLADKSADKRAKLIERLMAAPRFPERMADAFNIHLMERRGEDARWREYLVEAFKANKPWDQLAREIVAPEFLDEKKRAAGWFITRRLDKVGQQDTDYPGLTRDVGRLFLGVDLQCAQCHRHLFIKDYKQVDFNGLFVAFQNTKLNPAGGDYKTPWVSEAPLTNKYAFVSVLSSVKGETAPRVPFGTEVSLPDLKGDDLWIEKPDRKRNFPGAPKFSPLKELSRAIASKDNPWFTRNAVNRVWFLMMGRGLVEPLDLHHSENPPSHPELLDPLAKEFAAREFDLRWLIRELALTQTYQRSTRVPAGANNLPENLFLVAKERHLSFEQVLRAFLQATGEWERVSAGKAEGLPAGEKFYKLAEFETAFRAALANAPTEPEYDVNPTLRAALFFRNSDHVLWALKPRADNLVERAAKLSDPAQVADELHFAILTRPATDAEKSSVARWLEKHGADRAKAIGHYAWALLSSTEFFTNH